MAEEGWFSLFRHDATSHTMIISESNISFNKVPDGTVVVGPNAGLVTLTEWHPARATAHGKVLLGHFDPEKPSTSLSGETATTGRFAGAPNRDPFHWPARALTNDQIAQRTRQRMEAAEATAALSEGAGSNPNFFTGGRIQVSARTGGT